MKTFSAARILGAIACAYGSLFLLWFPVAFFSLVGLNPFFGCYDNGECWYLIPKIVEIPLLIIVWCTLWSYAFYDRKEGFDIKSFVVALVLVALPGILIWLGSYILGPAPQL